MARQNFRSAARKLVSAACRGVGGCKPNRARTRATSGSIHRGERDSSKTCIKRALMPAPVQSPASKAVAASRAMETDGSIRTGNGASREDSSGASSTAPSRSDAHAANWSKSSGFVGVTPTRRTQPAAGRIANLRRPAPDIDAKPATPRGSSTLCGQLVMRPKACHRTQARPHRVQGHAPASCGCRLAASTASGGFRGTSRRASPSG